MTKPYDIFDYPAYWQGREYENAVDKLAIKKLLNRVEKKDSLIDIAGGFGRLSAFLAPVFPKILLVDQSEDLLKEAKRFLSGYKNIEIKKGDCEVLPVPDESFDCALMVRITHHFESPERLFREAHRVLKPEGYLILEFANKIHFLACVRAYLRGDFGYGRNLELVEKRSEEAIQKEMITFCNHHPKAIQASLGKIGFKVVDRLSVSNCRFPLMKKVLPFHSLMFWENLTQRPFARFFFGPSIYFLCQKI